MVAPEDRQKHANGAEAALFEAISHPVKIEILYALRDNALGFSELKRKVGISSSGNLQHHLSKLDSLVGTDSDGQYVLTDQGREAVYAVDIVRNLQNRYRENVGLTTLVTSLIFYAGFINAQFLLHPNDPLVPLHALVTVLVFAPVYYALFSWLLKRKKDGI